MKHSHNHRKLKTVVNFILDKSGSMDSVRDTTIASFNEYLNKLKSDKKSEYLFSLTLFDSESIDRPYVAVGLDKVKPLTRETYVPNAMTPLYDAVVETVEAAADALDKEKQAYASIVVIMTDGMENASTKHDHKCLMDLRKRLEDSGKWTFVYMGSNQDAWAVAQDWGFSQGNTLTYQSTAAGVTKAINQLGQATMMYSAMANASWDNGEDNVRSVDFFNNTQKGK